ncbi:MAG: spondin domain-containing protein [Nitrospira sp.]|nr:spondin domain-containing protein [Nitrospira sp.]
MAKLKSGGGLFFPWRSDDIRARGRAPQPRFLSISRSTFSIITGLLLAACMALGIKPEPARAQNTATYTITFEGNWNAQSTPPGAPGGAHFTTLIGAVHNNDETFWAAGSLATAGVENVAETGSTTRFNSELVAARERNNVKTIIRFSVSGGGEATKTTTVEFSKDYPLFTILSMLGPSPDWFVGLSGFSLLDGNGNWYSSRTVDLFAYDAGTEEGTGWSLSNPASNPHVAISSLKGKGKFTNVRVARMTFKLMNQVKLSVRGSGPVTEGTSASFTVSANPAPSSNLTVNLNVSENSNNGRDFVATTHQGSKTVRIDAGTTSTTYSVATVNDNTDEPNGSVTVTVASGNGYTVVSPSSASVTVNDNDSTQVTLSAAEGNIPETGGTKTITVTLNRALAAGESLTVPLTFGGAARRNTDYMLAGTPTPGVTYNNLNSGSANIVFGSGARMATLTLSARDDTIDEGTAETVTVALGTPTHSGLGGGATSSGTASFSITDDDTGTVAGVMVSKGTLSLTEGGTADTYTMVLTKAPTTSVTVTATSEDAVVKVHTGSGPPADSVTLTFTGGTSGNWNQAQTVTVTPQQDADTTQDTVSITHTVSGTGDYARVTADSVTVTVADDDRGGGDDGSGPDESGPEFVATRFAFTLAENLVGPAPVRDPGGAPGVVRAAGTGVTYTLASGGDGLFQVDAATGAVHYVGPGEATGRYTLTVQATDSRERVAETQVTVEVRDAATVSRLNRVHRTVLPEAARLAAGSAFAAVSERLAATRTAARLQVAGYELQTAVANLAGTLATGAALPDLPQLLAGSEFVLPLSATGDAGGLAPVLWGAVDWTALSGGRVTDWDGGMLNAHLGADVRLSERLLGGLALSHARGTFDWTDQGGEPSVTGTYQSRMTSLMPYLGWTAHERLTGWAAATLGRGEVHLNDATVGKYDSEATAWSAGAGARGTLLAAGQMVLALKGEAWITQWEADGDGPLVALNAAAQRLRMALEGQQTWTLVSGSVVVPVLEVGVRHDGGDGETGTGLELGGGVRWSHPAQGLTIQARARTLLGRGSYRQWGVAGLVRVDPGADGRGLALSVSPALGVAASGVSRLWNEGVSRSPAAAATRYEPRLEAALGYGFATPGTSGTTTPYAGFSLTDTRAVTWRAGMRLAAGAGLDAHLETTWREPTAGAPDHGVMLEVRRRF